MLTPGYKTTEHALTWAVVLLGAIALFRSQGGADRLAALLGPAVASAAYSRSRGRAKSPLPFVPSPDFRLALLKAFQGRFVK